MSKVVTYVEVSVTEYNLNYATFDIIFAFNEVLTVGGYRLESVSIRLVCMDLAIESHEDTMHIMLRESKEAEARATMQHRY